MEAEEAASEMLECARYGEPEDLLVMLTEFRVDVNHKDAAGNSALHKGLGNASGRIVEVYYFLYLYLQRQQMVI